MDEAWVIARGIVADVPLSVALAKQSLWLDKSAGSRETAIGLENHAIAIAPTANDAKEKRQSFWDKRVEVHHKLRRRSRAHKLAPVRRG